MTATEPTNNKGVCKSSDTCKHSENSTGSRTTNGNRINSSCSHKQIENSTSKKLNTTSSSRTNKLSCNLGAVAISGAATNCEKTAAAAPAKSGHHCKHGNRRHESYLTDSSRRNIEGQQRRSSQSITPLREPRRKEWQPYQQEGSGGIREKSGVGYNIDIHSQTRNRSSSLFR